MSDLVNQLTAHTGLSPELVQKGLGALLSFLKKDAPYPPQFPKMPGEPMRVQPSRARKPTV